MLRAARNTPPVNWILSSIGRAVFAQRPPARLVRHLPRRGTVIVDVPGGGKVRFWSKGDDYITSRLWWMGISGYEPETISPFLRFVEQASVVVDLGAYTGYYSLMAAAANPSARVFSFEPNPRVAARLGHNLDLNPTLKVTVIPMAVGARREVASLHLGGPGLPLSSSLVSSWQGLHSSIEVQVIDLDSFADEWGLERVDVVKIDVEAGEDEVVRGMSGLLSRCRPVLFMEILPEADRRAMSAQFRLLDYELYHLTFSGPVRETDLKTADGSGGHAGTPFNHLVCPSERVPPWLRTP